MNNNKNIGSAKPASIECINAASSAKMMDLDSIQRMVQAYLPYAG